MTNDTWQHLRSHTAARIALGRSGGSLPTHEILRFAMDHAEARDAVHAQLDITALRQALSDPGLPMLEVSSFAADRTDYIRHPDHGRRLDDASRSILAAHPASAGECDVVLILADGLSATATQEHGPALTTLLVNNLHSAGLTLGPIVLARQARVAIQDDIGQTFRARSAIILLGERPGLGSADSLGAYYVFAPQVGNSDANRNCVSNIRPAGLPIERAAETLLYLVTESFRRGLSGVQLKDERDALLDHQANRKRIV